MIVSAFKRQPKTFSGHFFDISLNHGFSIGQDFRLHNWDNSVLRSKFKVVNSALSGGIFLINYLLADRCVTSKNISPVSKIANGDGSFALIF